MELLFEKKVDKSILKAGLTIPKAMNDKFVLLFQANNMNRGETKKISIKVNENVFRDISFQYSQIPDRTVYQIRYTMNSPIAVYLRKIFNKTANMINNKSAEEIKRIPKNYFDESIDICYDANILEFVCKPNGTVHQIPETTNEIASDCDDIDNREIDSIIEEIEDDGLIYNKSNFLRDTFISEQDYNKICDLLSLKKNIILQGAPGVGKSYAAKKLVYSLIGTKSDDKILSVQFHQSYSYEDFIMGYRPTNNGFELKTGAFYDFCKIAEKDSENNYYLIVDEINRGNLSKIFGELFVLIEGDKRSTESVKMLYSGEKFSVPSNLFLIGLMNTADRSLAMMDYALRRRFAFFTIKPGFETDGFRDYQLRLSNPKFNKLINCIKELNKYISRDESLGDGFCIGHSYFCNIENLSDERLNSIVEYEIIPLLNEYWYDEHSKVEEWANNLRSSIL